MRTGSTRTWDAAGMPSIANGAWTTRVLTGVRAIDWLRAVPEDELLALVRGGQVQQWRDGEVVVSQQEQWQACILLLEGGLRSVVSRADGTQFLLNDAVPGETLGLITLHDASIFPHSILAMGATLTLRIDADEFAALLQRQPACMPVLLRILQVRLALALKFLSLTTMVSLRDQLLGRLELRMKKQEMRGHPDPHVLRLSQRELADMLGASRQRVNAALHELQAAGRLKIGYGLITLVEPGA